MKITKCRSCSNNELKHTFNLGLQKLSGIFPNRHNLNKIPEGSLSMVFCEKCKLLQLENSFKAETMYGENYGYMSSLNSSMAEHLNKKAQNLVDDLIINKSYYRVDVSKGHKNVTIIDAGIDSLGNIEAGRIISEICLGGLGRVHILNTFQT